MVGFGPGGKILVSAGADGAVRRWDLDTGMEQGRFRLPNSSVLPMALAPDGRWLVALDAREPHKDPSCSGLLLFEVATGQLVRSLSPRSGWWWVVWSPDGTLLATGGQGRQIGFWEAATGKLLHSIAVQGFGGYCLAFSPDSRLVALEEQGAIVLRAVATGKVLQRLRGQYSVRALAFAPDGKTLLSSAGEMVIRRWDVRTGAYLPAGEGHMAYGLALAFTPDGKMLASGAHDRGIRLWDCATATQLHEFQGSEGVLNIGVAFSADGNALAAGGAGGIVRVWDARGKRLLRQLQISEDKPGYNVVYALAFSADGRTLFAGGFFDPIRRWDLASGKELPRLVGHKEAVKGLALSPAGKTLVSAGWDATLRFWDAPTGKELHCLRGHTGFVNDVAFSPDGKTVASGGGDGSIRLWDAATGREIRHWPTCHQVVGSVAFSPDGKYLASAGLSRVIGLWEAATGRALPPLVGHRGAICRVAFSPDGKALASTGEDTTILLWDVDYLFRQERWSAAVLTAPELEVCWEDLSDPETDQVRQARELLYAAGPRTVTLLRRRLPEALAEAGRLEGLIAALDSDDFATRKKASAALDKLGPRARPALRKALEQPPSLEVGQRVRVLLEKLPKTALCEGDEAQGTLQALTVLGWINTPEARQLLQEVAQGQPKSAATRRAQAILARPGNRSALLEP